jgi:hypothetical protein
MKITRDCGGVAAVLGSLLAVGLVLAGPAAAKPKKALSAYSKVCQDMHLGCLNDCQGNYTSDADIRTCMGVCDQWLDDDCDKAFPNRLAELPVLKQWGSGVYMPSKVDSPPMTRPTKGRFVQ